MRLLSWRLQRDGRHAWIGSNSLFGERKAQPLLAGEAPGRIAEMGRGGVVGFRMSKHGVRLHAVCVKRNHLQVARAVTAAINRVAVCIDGMLCTYHREITCLIATAKKWHALAIPV